jgi:steroid delta-isomerase-like uncharacterized protein
VCIRRRLDERHRRSSKEGTGIRVVNNKDVYRRIVAAINRGDAQALDELLASDIVDRNPIPHQAPGRGGFKQWMAAARTAFPDLHGTVDDLIAEGDRVAARISWRGTHHGDFVGVPPTGKVVAFSAFHLVRFSEGRAVEWWGTADLLGVLQQLGTSV